MYSETLQFITCSGLKRAEGFRQCLLVVYGTKACMAQGTRVVQNQDDTMHTFRNTADYLHI